MSETPSERIAALVRGDPAPERAPPASPVAGAPLFDDAGFDDDYPDATPPEDTNWELVRLCAAEPQNDIGNSRRLRTRFGADMLHVQNIGWFVYDERRWKEDIDSAGARPLCHKTVEAIAYEAYVIEPTSREQAEIDAATVARADLERLERDLDRIGGDTGLTPAARKGQADPLRREIEAAKATIGRGQDAAKAIGQRQAQRRRFANTSGNKGKVDGMLAEAVPYLSRPIGDLDADPLAFNVRNGTLRFVEREVPDLECPDPAALRTKREWVAEIAGHRREDMISKLADVEYDPKATAPIFEAMLERILPIEAVRDYVQRYLGYSITALTREQCFVLFHGEGRNGKSTLVDIIARILADYSTSIPIDTLVNSGGQKKGSEATPDLARLPGARMVRTAEPKEGVGFDESLIKGLTSDEAIPVRRLNAEFIDVYPTFKLVISANRKPAIKGNDDGIWRRVNLVPFDVQIPKEEVDKHLGSKLWAERSGILNWLLAGACEYLNRGKLDPPEEVSAATQEYRDESDLMAKFVRGALDVTKEPADAVEVGLLYQSFVLWCQRSGDTPFQPTTFTRRLPKTASQFGFEKGKASVSVYTGIQIRPEFTPRADSPPRSPFGRQGG